MTESETACDICKVRPATTEVVMMKNGEENRIHVCDTDLKKLKQQPPPTPKLQLEP